MDDAFEDDDATMKTLVLVESMKWEIAMEIWVLEVLGIDKVANRDCHFFPREAVTMMVVDAMVAVVVVVAAAVEILIHRQPSRLQ
jgi:hypothetical protein